MGGSVRLVLSQYFKHLSTYLLNMYCYHKLNFFKKMLFAHGILTAFVLSKFSRLESCMSLYFKTDTYRMGNWIRNVAYTLSSMCTKMVSLYYDLINLDGDLKIIHM